MTASFSDGDGPVASRIVGIFNTKNDLIVTTSRRLVYWIKLPKVSQSSFISNAFSSSCNVNFEKMSRDEPVRHFLILALPHPVSMVPSNCLTPPLPTRHPCATTASSIALIIMLRATALPTAHRLVASLRARVRCVGFNGALPFPSCCFSKGFP